MPTYCKPIGCNGYKLIDVEDHGIKEAFPYSIRLYLERCKHDSKWRLRAEVRKFTGFGYERRHDYSKAFDSLREAKAFTSKTLEDLAKLGATAEELWKEHEQDGLLL